MGDCGLTGRKIIVDTYGGMARHGGGAFSGKDPSKVDRSAAYAARWVAKNIVAAGLADRAEVQVAYAIGVAHPVSVMVETFGTEKEGRTRAQIARAVDEVFDLRPGSLPGGARTPPPDLPEDGRLRSLRSRRSRLHLGADRQGRGPARRHRALTEGGSRVTAVPLAIAQVEGGRELDCTARDRPSRADHHGPRPARPVRLPAPERAEGRRRRRLDARRPVWAPRSCSASSSASPSAARWPTGGCWRPCGCSSRSARRARRPRRVDRGRVLLDDLPRPVPGAAPGGRPPAERAQAARRRPPAPPHRRGAPAGAAAADARSSGQPSSRSPPR